MTKTTERISFRTTDPHRAAAILRERDGAPVQTALNREQRTSNHDCASFWALVVDILERDGAPREVLVDTTPYLMQHGRDPKGRYCWRIDIRQRTERKNHQDVTLDSMRFARITYYAAVKHAHRRALSFPLATTLVVLP